MNTRTLSLVVVGLLCLAFSRLSAQATLPFSQDWSDITLITTNDVWSGVANIIGYRGDDLTTATGQRPDTIRTEGTLVVDVNANQTNPNTFATGGVGEFHIPNPVVALQGSGTADAPNLVISINTTGATNVAVQYDLRDIDGSTDDAVQAVALQYRIGSSGLYINIPAGYVTDATTGPSLANAVTHIAVNLPATAENQPLVQIRIITTNAVGNDEWVGIDNIDIRNNLIVPVQLVSFTGTSTGPGCVQLSWATISEINNYGFTVQRSRDRIMIADVPNSFVPGYGTTNERHDYTFRECDVPPGTWFYRLKQSDLDGSEHFSEWIRVEVAGVTSVSESGPKQFELKQNYPNPFNPETRIQFSIETAGKTTLRVFNIIGQRVAKLFDDVAEPNTLYSINFHANNLTSGVYFYKLENNSRTAMKKLILAK